MDLTVPEEDAFLAEMDADEVADLFIVSQVKLTVGDEMKVTVEAAQGAKCGRCWKVLHSVKAVGEHEALCPPLRRCDGQAAEGRIKHLHFLQSVLTMGWNEFVPTPFIHIRACSSAGRAFGSHPRGRGFESLQVHHKSTVILIELRWTFLSNVNN